MRLDGDAAGAVLLGLIASGMSSSVVCTMAGQMIMPGFIRLNIPLRLRGIVTMAPAFVVVATGVNVTQAPVASQVVLSSGLPIPMIALIIFTSRRSVMGDFVTGPLLRTLAVAASVTVLSLNAVLLADVFGPPIAFMTD